MSVYDEFLWKKEIMGLVDDLTQETPTQVFLCESSFKRGVICLELW